MLAFACQLRGSSHTGSKDGTTILASIRSNLKTSASCNSSALNGSNPKSPHSSSLLNILHIRRSRSGEGYILSIRGRRTLCTLSSSGVSLSCSQTEPALTLSAAESSAAVHSAGRVDTRPSHEPSPVHRSSRKRGHKLSRSGHGKAQGTMCIFSVVLEGSSP